MRLGLVRLAWAAAASVITAFVLGGASSGQGAYPSFVVAHQRSFRPAPVVLVVFDELPVVSLLNDHGDIDGRLFPHFAELRRDSHWFRNTSTVAVLTHTALPALLTGRYPVSPRLHAWPRNLFTLVGGPFAIEVSKADAALCPEHLCRVPKLETPKARGHGLRDFGTASRGMRFRSFLSTIRRRGDPALYYLHLVAPHSPWIYLPSGRRYGDPRDLPGDVPLDGAGRAWGDRRWLVAQAHQRHLLQVRLVDRLLGAVIDRLRRAGLYRRALVVVTADHGVAFGAGLAKRQIRDETAGEVAYVPLFIKRPWQKRGRVSNKPVELVDVVPTVADVLDLSRVWRFDGHSVFSGPSPRGRRRRIDEVELAPGGGEVRRALERKLARFGRVGNSIRPYRVAPGPTEWLIGQPVVGFQAGEGAPGAVRLTKPEAKRRRPGPLVEGTVSGLQGQTDVTIALAAEGRIVSVTKAFRKGPAMRFQSLLPPGARTNPLRALSAFAVRDLGDGGVALAMLRTSNGPAVRPLPPRLST